MCGLSGGDTVKPVTLYANTRRISVRTRRRIRTFDNVAEIDDYASPEEWVRQAKQYRDQGNTKGARIASLFAARRAIERGHTIPNDWAAALGNDQQAEIELRMQGQGAQHDHYRGLALIQALNGLDAYEALRRQER